MIFSNSIVVGNIFNNFLFKSPTFCIDKLNENGNIVNSVYEGQSIKAGYFKHSNVTEDGEVISKTLISLGIRPSDSHFLYNPKNYLGDSYVVTVVLQMNSSMILEFKDFKKSLKDQSFKILADEDNRFSVLTDKYIQTIGQIQFHSTKNPDSSFTYVMHINPSSSFRTKI